MSKFYIVAKLSREFLRGMMQKPDQNRAELTKAMVEKVGLTFHSVEFVRGDYDMVGIVEGEYENVLGMKVAVMQTGMMDEMILLDCSFDINKTANNAAMAASNYTKTTD